MSSTKPRMCFCTVQQSVHYYTNKRGKAARYVCLGGESGEHGEVPAEAEHQHARSERVPRLGLQ